MAFLRDVINHQKAELAELRPKAAERDVLAVKVEEWKAVADRFATQAEKLAEAAEARRGWWPWRRRA